MYYVSLGITLTMVAITIIITSTKVTVQLQTDTVKPVFNDRLMGYFYDFWSSSRWPTAT